MRVAAGRASWQTSVHPEGSQTAPRFGQGRKKHEGPAQVTARPAYKPKTAQEWCQGKFGRTKRHAAGHQYRRSCPLFGGKTICYSPCPPITSQWPPLAPPTRRSWPCSCSLRRCRSMVRELTPVAIRPTRDFRPPEVLANRRTFTACRYRLEADGHYFAYFQKRPLPSAIQAIASSMRLSRVASVFASPIQTLYSF